MISSPKSGYLTNPAPSKIALCSFDFWCECVLRTLNVSSTHLTNFEVQNTTLLTVGTRLYRRSLKYIHLVYTWDKSPFALSPKILTTIIIFSASLSFIVLDTLYKWNYEVFVL